MAKRSGQVLIEFTLAALFVLIPLITGGVYWFHLEWKRSQCAYLAFFKARRLLILNPQKTRLPLGCGPIREEISLTPLEDLDQNKGELGLSDYANAVSQAWGDALRSLRRLQGSVSSKSWDEPKT